MSNRKAHRRDKSFRRAESLRRPLRSARHERQVENRSERRSVWRVIEQWLAEFAEVTA